MRRTQWLLFPPLTVAGGLVATLAAEGTARARDVGVEWNMSTDARVGWMRAVPDMSSSADTYTRLRVVHSGTVPAGESLTYAALAWDSSLVVNGRWMIPMVGAELGWAIGASSDVASSLDGSIVTMRPASATFFSLQLPGFGYRVKARRWTLAVSARPTVTALWMAATAEDGAASFDLGGDPNLFAAGFGVRADLEGCRRLDPVERVCLFVAPALYEFAPLNGGSIGIRMEFGP